MLQCLTRLNIADHVYETIAEIGHILEIDRDMNKVETTPEAFIVQQPNEMASGPATGYVPEDDGGAFMF